MYDRHHLVLCSKPTATLDHWILIFSDNVELSEVTCFAFTTELIASYL